ncbi:hypothetical protein HFN89_00095 [Rhizobium laguerreae]|nr:hypothetical protein [Rhizobium laguerreae]
MSKGVNRAARAAEDFLASIKGKPTSELSDIEYLALIGARAVLHKQSTMAKWRAKNVSHQRWYAKKWGEENPERKRRNNRISALRSAIEKLNGKPASKNVDWPSRVDAYEKELAELLAGAV